MEKEENTWTLHGVGRKDARRIRTVEEAVDWINEAGFLPLFHNGIAGFSLEERTVAEDWWSDDPYVDPWKWREIIARSGEAVYGKLFDGKAGFLSKEWLPYFANYRRDGYDFDARWEDGKAPLRQKKIMDLFAEDVEGKEYYSFEVKQMAGFGKNGEKGFDGALSALQMQTYLCLRDFRQRRNKQGEPYGWSIAVYTTPEHLFGYEAVTAAYREAPEESGRRIAARVEELFPSAEATQVRHLAGTRR